MLGLPRFRPGGRGNGVGLPRFGRADDTEFKTGVGLPRFGAADAERGGKWSGPPTFWGRGRHTNMVYRHTFDLRWLSGP